MKDEARPPNVMNDSSLYEAFYEERGTRYPETENVHTDRSIGSRYWTVLDELKLFTRAAKRLLDIGCNNGVYTIPYVEWGGKAIGVDISSSLIEKCKAKAEKLGISCSFLRADVDSPSFGEQIGERFDVVLFSEVLEHLRSPERALANVRSSLEDKGYLILTTPTPLFNGVHSKSRYLLRLFGRRRLTESNVVDTRRIPVLLRYGIAPSLYRHDGYYPRALTRYVERFGFRCVKSYTIEYPRKVQQALFVLRLSRGGLEMTQENSFGEPPRSHERGCIPGNPTVNSDAIRTLMSSRWLRVIFLEEKRIRSALRHPH